MRDDDNDYDDDDDDNDINTTENITRNSVKWAAIKIYLKKKTIFIVIVYTSPRASCSGQSGNGTGLPP